MRRAICFLLAFGFLGCAHSGVLPVEFQPRPPKSDQEPVACKVITENGEPKKLQCIPLIPLLVGVVADQCGPQAAPNKDRSDL